MQCQRTKGLSGGQELTLGVYLWSFQLGHLLVRQYTLVDQIIELNYCVKTARRFREYLSLESVQIKNSLY